MTTASLHREMVEALRRAGEREMTDTAWEGEEANMVCSDCACDPCDEDCRTVGPRAALESWEKRPRLRDDPELFRLVDNQLAHCGEAEPLLAMLDTLLYGERG